MNTWRQDIRFGLRQLRKNPTFTIVAALALGLGIGANTAIFSVVDAVILRPLPFAQPDRLVTVWDSNPGRNVDHQQISPVAFHDYRAMNQVFGDIAGWWIPDINLTDDQNEPIRVQAIDITDNFFSVLGVQPVLGRALRDGEDRSGADPVVVIGHGLWQRRYGGADGILGSTITLDGRGFEVVGVMPAWFDFPKGTELWRPLGWDPSQHSRHAHFFEVVGRLAPGVSVRQAQAELDSVNRLWEDEFASSNKGWRADIVRLHDEIVGDIRPLLMLLLASVGLVLLIACANVANLLLARSSVREREVAVRSAIGAGRWRIIRQFLTESVLLAVLGGLLGLLIAFGGLRALLVMTPIDIPRLEQVALDARVLGFTFLVAVVTGILFGLIPALQLARSDIHETLKEGGREASGRLGTRMRGVLVIGEVALAMTLLVGAGLLIRSFFELIQERPGFETSHRLTVNLQLPRSAYRQWDAVSRFYVQLLDRLREKPGVEAADGTGFLPLKAAWRVNVRILHRPSVPAEELPQAQYRTVSLNYFKTMGVALQQGRFFDERDDQEAPGVILINQKMSDRNWPDGDPIGDRISAGTGGFGPLGRTLMATNEYEIVGVVANVKNNSLQSEVEPAIYFTQRQFPYRSMNIIVKGRGTSAQLASAVREEVRALDSSLPLTDIRTLEEVLSDSVAQPRFFMLLLTGFAALAMVLAALGIYGVLSYTVSQRQHEIGLRMALGAEKWDVLGLVVRQGVVLTLIGVALGTILSLALTRIMSGFLYGIEAMDPLTFIGVPMALLLIGLIACFIPAHRASTVDPLIALRQ